MYEPVSSRVRISGIRRQSHTALQVALGLWLVVCVVVLCWPATTPAHAATQLYNSAGLKQQRPLGYQVITPTVATAFTVPVGASHAMISVRAAGVMMADDGSTPTTTAGFYIPAGTIFQVNNDRPWLLAWRVVNSSDGAATVYVIYYGDR